MAGVEIRGVTMRHGDTVILDDVTLEVVDRELLVLLGASGAGKSALLRVVAGLDAPDEGRVFIGGADVTETETAQRGIAMVFQDSALFPFMDVRRNVSFPLDIRRMPKDERDARVTAETRVLEIEHLLDRMPRQLAAGHQQLVQAARALVRSPDVFLMDEPLARLDSHLRVVMRREFKLLQSGYGVTTLYVTNDPEEAMAMADRIAVIDRGRIAQVGAPLEVYRRPASRVVGAMMGNPPMSMMAGRIVADPPGYWVEVGPLRVRAWDPALGNAPGSVEIGVRSEDVVVDDAGVRGVVVAAEHLGSISLYKIEVAPETVVPLRSPERFAIGEIVGVRLRAAHVFDAATGGAVGHVDGAVS